MTGRLCLYRRDPGKRSRTQPQGRMEPHGPGGRGFCPKGPWDVGTIELSAAVLGNSPAMTDIAPARQHTVLASVLSDLIQTND